MQGRPLIIDPLAASTFTLLDKHSSLRLVTDAVHEDDALCLALACRALRKTLWERFPTWPAGDMHAGARLHAATTAVAPKPTFFSAHTFSSVLRSK